ncbi:CCA tRNA nucleotidyltransferase [Leptospira licerasiae]|uniref:tRNA nucleotidyltransferase/poly(A) polymerase family protein n=1 Tax=Leptospira licerasiae str. MMD4847 TaxID=1049971 RepID=A0ABN0H8D8_9LEPT|nr:[cytidine(C)-cytidine(C)-adenosine (A)]-adding enzyme [Leptospira licerasiae]EJZ41756.1 tRNA nucleotidyltransferase/poly(A) polymerase family protein [Leptospira licerasiae str. MMD4847]
MIHSDPNKLISQIPSPFLEDLLEIGNIVRNYGGEAYLVGGSVRDLVLNKIPHEYDLAVSIHPEEIQKIFKRTVPTGIKHGTITVLFHDRSYELTTFRKDEDYIDGRRPETVQFGVSLSEDLKRRDFTMNSLALDLQKKKLVDEHSGLEDIQNSLIRTIGDPVSRFTEDGLRPVRAIRFVSSLGFTIHPETAEAIDSCREITAKVSPERIHDEFLKVLKSKNPIGGLDLLKKHKTLELFSKTKLYSGDWEKHKNGFSKLLHASEKSKIAYFLISCFSEQNWFSDSNLFFKELKFSNQRTKDSQFLVKTLYSLIQQKEELKTSPGLRTHLLHPIAQFAGKKDLWDWCLEVSLLWAAFLNEEPFWLASAEREWKNNPPLLLSDLSINGNLVREKFPNIPPPKLGEVLRSSLLSVLQDPSLNSENILLENIRNSI